jgi:hypothetical protein
MPFLNDSNADNYINIGKVSLYFNSKQCSGNPDDSPAIPNFYLSTSSINGSQGSLNETIQDTALAYFNSMESMPLNQAVLDLLTGQFELDYSNWKKIHFDFSFAGVLNLKASGLVDTLEIDYSFKDLCKSRFYSYSLDYRVENLGHYDYGNDCQCTNDDLPVPNWDEGPYIAYYAPPLLGSGSTNLQLARWGLMLTDGRLMTKFISFDEVCPSATASCNATGDNQMSAPQFSIEDTFGWMT